MLKRIIRINDLNNNGLRAEKDNQPAPIGVVLPRELPSEALPKPLQPAETYQSAGGDSTGSGAAIGPSICTGSRNTCPLSAL